MVSISRKAAAAALAVQLIFGNASPAAGAEKAITDAREQAPEGLIGLWKADLDASTFSGSRPKAMLRSFAYTEDGKILVSFATHSESGDISFGHWAAQVDGTPGIEYHSAAGAVAYNVVAWKVVGEGRLELTVSRHGEETIHANYQLSDDRQTLTYRYGGTTVVYRRWNMLD